MFLLNVDVARFEDEFVHRIIESLNWFAPEFQIAVTAIAILLLDLFIPKKASKHLAWLAALGCVYAAGSALALHHEEKRLFLGMLAIDSYASFYKVFFLLGGVPFVLLSYMAKELEGKRMGEYYSILLAALLGGMLMASSNHLLMAFMSLELLSISSYVLVGYHRRQSASSEAALKYIIYGSVASAAMGYGLSLLYGVSGSGEIPRVLASITAEQGADAAVLVGLLLTFLGFAYKMATIPMHFWSPDVYEGAPTPVTAFLSVGSKAAGFALTMRVLGSTSLGDASLERVSEAWPAFLMVVAMITMTLGNLAALFQENVKRLFAYSSIAHAGYMMMGVALLDVPGISGSVGMQYVSFYLLAYLAMNLGAFAVVVLIENKTGSVELKDYEALGWRAPFLGVALVVFLFSLVGIPPTAGFTGKFQLFMGVINAALDDSVSTLLCGMLIATALFALVNTAISVYYYFRLFRQMYLVKMVEAGERIQVPILGHLVVAVLLIMTFYLFFNADEILDTTLTLHIFTGA